MGFKPFQPIYFAIFFFISLLPLINGHGHSHSPQPLDHKAYLHRYGYLDYARANAITTDDESDVVKSAIKTFQENFHIKPTGILDSETLTAMKTPRCGVPDIVNGTNYMQPRLNSSKFATFPDNPKWSKFQLSYLLETNFPQAAKFSLELAFTQWRSNSFFSFNEDDGSDHSNDLTLGFYRLEHGDEVAFDGLGGVVAHGFPPDRGVAHFDADDKWSYENENGAPRDALDFETVALHEIGHLLGLAHSPINSAIMYPFMDYGEVKTLGDDDIQGLRSLYG